MIQYFDEHKNTQKTKNGKNIYIFLLLVWTFYVELDLEMGQPTSYLVMFTRFFSLSLSLALIFIAGYKFWDFS